jgi:hypothetical protein
MKKITTLTAALAFVFAGNVFAQTENIAVTANVESALNFVTDPATVEFGTVQSGLTSTVSSDPDGTDENASAPQRAVITIENTFDEGFEITYTNAVLTDTNGDNATSFTTSIFVVSGTVANNGSTIASGATIGAAGGDIVLSIGGVLDAINATNAGSYSTGNPNGEDITVEFNLTTI